MAKIKDGWHTILGCKVYVEEGRVIRGISTDYNGSPVTVWPYCKSKYGGWDNCSGLTVSAFRYGLKNETIILS